ncbi:MAG: squalene--hopene cyclase [Planctomycetota bacterium]
MRWQALGSNGTIPQAVLDRFAYSVSADFLPEAPSSDLQNAIKKTQDFFLGTQKPDGHWVGELEADATLTADYILMMHFLAASGGEVGAIQQRKAANYILSKRCPDGGWNLYANGPSEVSASVKAYFALRLAGYSPDEPFMTEAKECIIRLGGIMKCNAFMKIYLSIFKQLDPKWAPATPVEAMLLPPILPFSIYEMSYWSRCIVIPLTIVQARNYTVDIGFNMDELYAEPRKSSKDDIDWERPALTWYNFFINIDHFFKRYQRRPIHWLRELAVKKAARWIMVRQEKSAGLGAIWPGIINTIFALKALGYPNDHPEIKRQLREIELLKIEEEDSLRMQPCTSPVWDTGWAVIALHDSGLNKEHPQLVKAGRWLLSKEVRNYGDWRIKNPKVEPSGWYFEYACEWFPDTDDSAVVMMGLQRIAMVAGVGKQAALLRGTKWLLGMQCSDGGWAAFDKDNNKEFLNHIPFADFGSILDPSTSDVTGRCLDWFGRVGFDVTHGSVTRAVAFLKKNQEEDGSWFGRWGNNYIYGTWSALVGLASVDEDMEMGYVHKAVAWLKSVQQPNGGWGERCTSYHDPSCKGKGLTTPSHTAWALMGLLAAGEVESPEVGKGVRYLIDTQKDDGTWDEDEWNATGFPRFFYLEYHLYRNYFPLMALSRYRNLKRREKKVRAVASG